MMKPHDQLQRTIEYLAQKQRVLIITTSNRWEGAKDVAKSTQLAQRIQQELGTKKCTLLDATKMHIHQCEGNISGEKNTCGVKDAKLKDDKKNPSGHHRCWASINHDDDDLWKISKELLECDVVLFVGSIRWGTMNAVHQTLMERLSWLENRHSTLGESNILKGTEAGVICTGQNWRGKEVVDIQRQVLEFYGFETPEELSWNWQYTKDSTDETQASYKQASKLFPQIFKLTQHIKESFKKFFRMHK